MLLITYGTRPEYIKILPIIKEMKKKGLNFKTLFTGQHKDLVEKNSDYILTEVYNDDNRLDSIIKNCLTIPNDYFKDITAILVQGDTTSVVGLALAALHRKIKVIHLEAGLRTYDYENPYPEENNRRIVSSIATIHLCPTKDNAKNLKKEKILGEIYVVGNTVLDNLIEYKEKCEYTNKVLITLHRRENHDEMDKWFTEINILAKENPDLEFILPIHPNPNVQKYKSLLTNINVVNPMNHNELLNLLVKTKLVITDSGGIQEECSFFNKKCLVCRKTTERPESIGLTSFIVDDYKNLIDIFDFHIKNAYIDDKIKSPYGDGFSAKKIIKIFKKLKI
jgi:UDP-N-acetylglucosamine 2-epimerase